MAAGSIPRSYLTCFLSLPFLSLHTRTLLRGILWLMNPITLLVFLTGKLLDGTRITGSMPISCGQLADMETGKSGCVIPRRRNGISVAYGRQGGFCSRTNYDKTEM